MVAAALVLAGCTDDLPHQAKQCGVSETRLRDGIRATAKGRPYSSQRSGRCNLLVDDTRHVLVFTPKLDAEVKKLEN